jgi:hypothetical protein
MLPTRRIEVLAALAGLVFAAGCGQGEGDRCEIDDDCSGELVCVLDQQRTEGTCRPMGFTRQMDAAVRDANADTGFAPSPDAAPDTSSDRQPDTQTDAAVDAGSDAAPDGSGGG